MGARPHSLPRCLYTLRSNLHDYTVGSEHYAGPYVTGVGLYNHTLASPIGSWWLERDGLVESFTQKLWYWSIL